MAALVAVLYPTGMKTAGDISKRLNVHTNTIRNWTKSYAAFMSSAAQRDTPGAKSHYTDRDALVLATIAHYRDLGLSHEQITERLTAGDVIEAVPELPTPEVEQARRDIALVPVADLKRALDQLKYMTDERDRLIDERNTTLQGNEALNARIQSLEREIGLLQGQISERKPAAYWLAVIAGVVLAVVLLAGLVIVLVLSV